MLAVHETASTLMRDIDTGSQWYVNAKGLHARPAHTHLHICADLIHPHSPDLLTDTASI